MVVPNNHWFSYWKWSFWGVLGVITTIFGNIHIYPISWICPSNKLLKLLVDVWLHTQKSHLKKRLLFLIANLHIKLTHHANEDIQYKDLGRLRCFTKKNTRRVAIPSGQVHSKKSDFGGHNIKRCCHGEVDTVEYPESGWKKCTNHKQPRTGWPKAGAKPSENMV